MVRPTQTRLYYVLGHGQAMRYPVAVGEPRFQWSGKLWVSSKQANPTWRPTARMRRDNPGLPRSVGPGPRNPLGPRALYLYRNGRDTFFRLHGTTEPETIGSAVSSGCIRLFNQDIIDLYDRVRVGTHVTVV